MKKLTILLYLTLTCCLLACEREMMTSSSECVYEMVDMYIHVEAFISKSSPKEVILKITGFHHNGCVGESQAYHQVDGRTITVWATKYADVGGCYCTDMVEVIDIAIYIGTLEAGAYKVVSRSGEQLLTFHIDNLENMTINECLP